MAVIVDVQQTLHGAPNGIAHQPCCQANQQRCSERLGKQGLECIAGVSGLFQVQCGLQCQSADYEIHQSAGGVAHAGE